MSNLERLYSIAPPLGSLLSSRERQRLKEMFHVCHLLDELGVSIDTRLVPNDPPGPDFYLQLGEDRWVGVEETEAFPDVEDGRPPHFQELRHRAVYEAWVGFRARGGPPLRVVFHFNNGMPYSGPLSEKDVPVLTAKLEYLIDESAFHEEFKPQKFHGSKDIPEVRGFSITPCEASGELWSIAGTISGEVLQPQRIQLELDKKKDRYPGYIQTHSRVWLLLANEGVQRGVPSRIGEGASSSLYCFPFERAFWMDCMPMSVTELKKATLE